MKTRLLFFCSLFLLGALPAHAQWTTDSTINTKVRDSASLSLSETKIATAPNGYSFISWSEAKFGGSGYQYRMQLLDSAGYNLWGPQGITIDTAIGSTLYRYDLKADKAGNAIIAIQDHRSGNNKPVVFKVSQAGTMLWGANGIVLDDTAQTSGLSPVIGITDSNNVIVSWAASGLKTFSSTVQISAAGTLMWPDNIRQIDRVTSKKYERGYPIPTGGEGFILQYVERTGTGLGVSTMYAQRYTGAGTAVWATPTQVSNKTIGFAYFPAPFYDGYGGFFVSFTTSNPTSASISDVYVQRVYADGHTWNATGNEAATGSTIHKFEAGAAYIPAINNYLVSIKFTDLAQGASGIMLQKVDTAGAIMLATTGVTLIPLSSGAATDIINVSGAVRMDTSIVIVYQIGSSPSPITIRAIRSDALGNLLWATPGGIPVSTASSDKLKFGISEYIQRQLIVTWTDKRLSNGGAYAQNIFSNGNLGKPPCNVFVLSPATFPADTVGVAYNASLSQTGGVGNVIYSLFFGVLPPGMSMSSAGVVTGTPTDQGNYPFVITATDMNGCTNNYNYNINVICHAAFLAPFAPLCDTITAFALSGGTPAGGTYSGQNVLNGVFNAAAAGAGSHPVLYTWSTGTTGACIRSATQNIVVTHCGTGISNVPGGILARVYPNPTSGQVTLQMNNIAPGRLHIRIVSLTGQTVVREEAESNGSYQKTYDLSNVAKGMYVVEIRSGNDSGRVKISVQ